MEENKNIQGLPLVDRHTMYSLVIPENVQRKIREWCFQFPTKEWSGTLFYTVEGAFSDGSLKIMCRDIYVSDIGTGAYTKFDHKADIVTYMDEHDLLDCYTGLIHSHNQMKAFFSGTDQATLRAEGSAMPHFVSLIVNNEGTYCAKITRRVSFPSSSAITYPTWDGKTVTEEVEVTVNEYLEAFPLAIQIEEDTSVRDEVLKRIKEIEEEKRSRPFVNPNPKYPVAAKPYNQKTEDDEPWWKTPMPDAKLEIPVQGTLFPSKEEKVPAPKKVGDGSYVNIEVPKDIVRRTFIQLITGSVTAGFSDKFDIRQWTDKVMDKAFKRRFPDQEMLFEWVDFYTEWIVWNTYFPGVEKLDDEMRAAAVADALLEESSQYVGGDVLTIIESKLEEFI